MYILIIMLNYNVPSIEFTSLINCETAKTQLIKYDADKMICIKK
jgi:hypothetical protein